MPRARFLRNGREGLLLRVHLLRVLDLVRRPLGRRWQFLRLPGGRRRRGRGRGYPVGVLSRHDLAPGSDHGQQDREEEQTVGHSDEDKAHEAHEEVVDYEGELGEAQHHHRQDGGHRAVYHRPRHVLQG